MINFNLSYLSKESFLKINLFIVFKLFYYKPNIIINLFSNKYSIMLSVTANEITYIFHNDYPNLFNALQTDTNHR